MKTVWTLASALLLGSVLQAVSVTIPAGTILTVATLQTVSSIDAPGTAVPAQLMEPVRLNGKVVLPTGSYFNGKIITSRRLISTSHRLSVNLTAVRVGVRDVPLTTTGPYLVTDILERRNGPKLSRGYYTVAAGRRMQFQLAQPLVF